MSHEQLAPGSATPGANRCSMLEIEVADADREYQPLADLVQDRVKPPTTKAWGSRSTYFRDPEGNLVSFCMRRSSPE